MQNPFESIDKTKLGWYHVKSLIVSAIGTFTDGYDLTALGLVLPFVLGSFGINSITSREGIFWATWLNAIPIFGFFIGAPIFGLLSNRGRKKLYGFDLLLMSIGAFMQIFANSLDYLTIYRLIMGVGLGGDYVMSPMIISENATAKDRGRLLGIGFGGFWVLGSLISSIVALILKYLANTHIISLDLYWRILLGIGALPPLSMVYFRRKMPETPRFIARILGDAESFRELVFYISKSQIQTYLSVETRTIYELLKKYWPYITLGSLLWFLFDIPAYGQSFFISYISDIIGFKNPPLLQAISIIFVFIGAIHFWYLHPRFGSKNMQSVGFLGMGSVFFVFAVLIEFNLINAFTGVFLFSLAKYFSQIGPGSIVAVGAYGVELVPTKIRGIASAINTIGGRLGVLVSTFILPNMLSSHGESAYYFMGVIAILGAVITYIFAPETANRGLEEITKELE